MSWPRVPGGHTHARVPGVRGAGVIREVNNAEQGVWGDMKQYRVSSVWYCYWNIQMWLFLRSLFIGIQSRLSTPRFLICQYEMLVSINQRTYYYYKITSLHGQEYVGVSMYLNNIVCGYNPLFFLMLQTCTSLLCNCLNKYPHQKGSKEFVRTFISIIKKFGSCLDVMRWSAKKVKLLKNQTSSVIIGINLWWDDISTHTLCVYVYDDKNLILSIIGVWCGKTADNNSCQPTNVLLQTVQFMRKSLQLLSC